MRMLRKKNRDHSFVTDFGGPDTDIYLYSNGLLEGPDSPNGFEQIPANHQLNVCVY